MAQIKSIERNRYPELNLILWDRAESVISPEDAFAAYETRWRYCGPLLPDEKALLDELTRTYGSGLFLSA